MSSVAAEFCTVLHAHHAEQACRQLSPALRQSLQQEHAAARCADAVANMTPRRSAIAGVRIYTISARVDLAGAESVSGAHAVS